MLKERRTKSTVKIKYMWGSFVKTDMTKNHFFKKNRHRLNLFPKVAS